MALCWEGLFVQGSELKSEGEQLPLLYLLLFPPCSPNLCYKIHTKAFPGVHIVLHIVVCDGLTVGFLNSRVLPLNPSSLQA